jgi:hypothetical protein
LINLNAYTTHALDHLIRVGAWAIYVIRPSGPKMPVKIGRTTDPQAALVETARRSLASPECCQCAPASRLGGRSVDRRHPKELTSGHGKGTSIWAICKKPTTLSRGLSKLTAAVGP